MGTAMERKPTPALPSPLTLTTSARRTTPRRGSKSVVEQGELQGFWIAPSYPTAFQTDHKGWYFIVFQVPLLPDPSGHTRGCLE